ncbi:hypothetical protein [Coleofasciculus sp. E1-EBD-02]|uniref:hypothetical protein n=1 Tax=Coleofasciculus sp. E1-EBD-02 TaxID=3068481 RepID=UPI0033030D8E
MLTTLTERFKVFRVFPVVGNDANPQPTGAPPAQTPVDWGQPSLGLTRAIAY